METLEQERARVARHEAAHAVAFVHYHYPIDFVTIVPEGEKWGRVRSTHECDEIPTAQYAKERAIISLVPHEDAWLHQVPPPGSSSDEQQAEEIIRLAHPDGSDVRPLLHEARYDARRLVRQPDIQRAITALAKALLRKKSKTIQGRQATAIIQKARQTYQSLNRYDEAGYVAIGEVGLCNPRLSQISRDGREYEVVTVIGVRPGKRTCWLLVRDEMHQEHCLLARMIYDEKRSRWLYPSAASRIWGHIPADKEKRERQSMNEQADTERRRLILTQTLNLCSDGTRRCPSCQQRAEIFSERRAWPGSGNERCLDCWRAER